MEENAHYDFSPGWDTTSILDQSMEVSIETSMISRTVLSLQTGIEFKKNLRVRFGLKLEYFWVVKSKKAKSFIRS